MARSHWILALLASLLAATPAAADVAALWRALPAALPADSLAAPLAALEARPPAGATSAEAAMLLGQWHYARGEYRQAAEAFTRAAAHTNGSAREAARYWLGVSLLGAGWTGPARDALDGVAGGNGTHAALASLAVAQSYELEGHAENALAELRELLASAPGEAGAAALERLAALSERLHHEADARQARERLVRDYPASIEAARLIATPPPAPAAGGMFTVQIGVFADHARALALAEAARRADFADAAALERTAEGRAPMWAVHLGRFGSAEAARAAGQRCERALGVAWQVQAP